MNKLGDMLIEGLQEAVDYLDGKPTKARARIVRVPVPETIDVATIRTKLGLGRTAFAARYGFSLRTLIKWETGQRVPEGPARAYLTVIAKEPEAVARALEEA